MKLLSARLLLVLLATSLTLGASALPVMGQQGNGGLFLPYMVQDKDGGTSGSVDAPGHATEEEVIVKLPLYTEEELEELRGVPLNPESSDTLYLPPGIETIAELPPCEDATVDDPSTEIDEGLVEHERWLQDGTYERNYQSRVLLCQYIPNPSHGISMTVEEFDSWWEENGRPTIPDPALDHPDGVLFDQTHGGISSNLPTSVDQTSTHSWGQFDLISTGSPDLRFGTFYGDLVWRNPVVNWPNTWNDSSVFARIVAGHNSSANCSGYGLDKIQVGVAKGKWSPFTSAVTSTNAKVVYTYNTSGGCAAQNTTWEVSDSELVGFRLDYYCCGGTTWAINAYVDAGWRALASTNTNWSNNYARRIAAGYELYASNSQKGNVDIPNIGALMDLIVDIPGTGSVPWTANGVGSLATSILEHSPLNVRTSGANILSYTSMLVNAP